MNLPMQVISWLERRSTLAIYLAFALASVVFTWPLLSHIDFWGIQDWDFNYFKQAAARTAVVDYRQLPLWNPWYFGGTAMLGEPESRILYPTFPLYLAFDPVRVLKLEVVIHYFVGLVGAFTLARYYHVSRYGAVTAAFVYMFSGMFAVSIGAGMTLFMVAAYTPWLFFTYLRSLEEKEWAVVAAAVLALMFLGGAIHFVAFGGLWLACYGCAQLLYRPRPWKAVAFSLITIAVFAGAFSAVKLLPTLEFMAKYPRGNIWRGSGFSVESFADGLLYRHQDLTVPLERPQPQGFLHGQAWGFDETGMYIGIFGVLLWVAGIGWCLRSRHSRRQSLPLLAAMTFTLWLSFGFRVPWSAWAIVHELPIFDAMRTPERIRYEYFLAVALFAAFAVDGLRVLIDRRKGARWAAAVGLAIPTLLFIDYRIVNAPTLALGASVEPLSVERALEFEQIPRLRLYCMPGLWLEPDKLGPPADICSSFSLYPTMLSNRGGLDSDAAISANNRPKARAAGTKDYKGEVFVEGAAGQARYAKWSPNVLVVDAALLEPGLVVINQNHDNGWRTNTGAIEAFTGLLAVRVPAGQHTIELTYMPTNVALGLGVTLVSAVAGTALAVFLRRRRRQSSRPTA